MFQSLKKQKIVLLGIIFAFTLVFGVQQVNAEMLDPQIPLTQAMCGNELGTGNYTLGEDINVGSSTPCFTVTGAGVYITPNSFSLTAKFIINNDGTSTFGQWDDNDTSWGGREKLGV